MATMTSAGGIYRRCGCVDPDSGRAWGSACPKLSRGGRHGSWYIRLELPKGPDGRRRRVRRGGFATRKAAEETLARLRAPGNPETGTGVVTVGEWLAHWLATRTRASSTVRGYASHVRLYLVPHLGGLLLAGLSHAHVQAMFTAIVRDHEVKGRPIAAATLNRIRATLRTELNAAIRQSLIADNPASYVELPGQRRPRAVVWTAARVE
ncbi:Arm DNA-binding domain-containing protein, partial [Actinomadura adrarensis]